MRVLIIEDNVEILKCMKVELEKSGLYVDIANNGLEGEEKAYVNEYDVILLDLNLPDKDGMEILKYLRKENERRRASNQQSKGYLLHSARNLF